jgi:hypothetical protein
MPGNSIRILYWAPRLLTIAFILFVSLFALDVFQENLGFRQTLVALSRHLIPSMVLSVILAISWKWEWIGAVAYTAAGLLYVHMVMSTPRPLPTGVQVNRILVIAGPAFVVAGLFLMNWLKRSQLHVVPR